jgi:hypothetical protein
MPAQLAALLVRFLTRARVYMAAGNWYSYGRDQLREESALMETLAIDRLERELSEAMGRRVDLPELQSQLAAILNQL